MSILEMYRAGDFNSFNGELQADGTVIITLAKRGEGKVYKAQVKDFNGPNEAVLWEEVIE